MKLSRPYRVVASSLGETVIAMALIAICLMLATAIYGQVISGSDNLSSFEAEQKTKELLWQMVEENDFQDMAHEFGGYQIHSEVNRLESEDLIEVNFKIDNQNSKDEKTFLIYAN